MGLILPSISPYFLGRNVALARFWHHTNSHDMFFFFSGGSWMSQEASKRLVTGL